MLRTRLGLRKLYHGLGITKAVSRTPLHEPGCPSSSHEMNRYLSHSQWEQDQHGIQRGDEDRGREDDGAVKIDAHGEHVREGLVVRPAIGEADCEGQAVMSRLLGCNGKGDIWT